MMMLTGLLQKSATALICVRNMANAGVTGKAPVCGAAEIIR